MQELQQIREHLRALGARAPHEDRVLRRWAQVRPQQEGRRRPEHFMPAALVQALPEIEQRLAALASVQSEHPARDGSVRLLVGLQDGQSVETVLLPRDGVCISSQIGCAVGCRFCMTGQGGLLRQVGSAEMVAQVVLARQRRPVRKVVFMGMGEPAHNLDAVLDAIDLLGTVGNVAHKSLVLSTVGDPRVFERLPGLRVKPALALSLHSTRDDLRAQLLPRAPRISPQDLVAAGQAYARQSGYPIQYQWTLIDGVNDSPEELAGIVRLLKGQYAIMNMIPYNQVEGLPYRRPDPERAAEIARWLHQQGVLTKLRQSAGQDVDAGCGQLRARSAVVRVQRTRLENAPVSSDNRPLGGR